MLDSDGNYKVRVRINVIAGDECVPVTIKHVKLVCDGDHLEVTGPEPAASCKTYDEVINIERSRASSTDNRKWHVEVTCDGEPSSPPPYNSGGFKLLANI